MAIGGKNTLRWTYDSGDAEYLLFIPLAEEQPQITIAHNTDGTITIVWTGGGTLQATTSLVAPITWQDVTATSPYTFTPQAGVPSMFGRSKK